MNIIEFNNLSRDERLVYALKLEIESEVLNFISGLKEETVSLSEMIEIKVVDGVNEGIINNDLIIELLDTLKISKYELKNNFDYGIETITIIIDNNDLFDKYR